MTSELEHQRAAMSDCQNTVDKLAIGNANSDHFQKNNSKGYRRETDETFKIPQMRDA